jgi:hypothetical protein
MLESEGFLESCVFQGEDGCDVGQSDADTCSEGLLLGTVLVDGDTEGLDIGCAGTDGG